MVSHAEPQISPGADLQHEREIFRDVLVLAMTAAPGAERQASALLDKLDNHIACRAGGYQYPAGGVVVSHALGI